MLEDYFNSFLALFFFALFYFIFASVGNPDHAVYHSLGIHVSQARYRALDKKRNLRRVHIEDMFMSKTLEHLPFCTLLFIFLLIFCYFNLLKSLKLFMKLKIA